MTGPLPSGLRAAPDPRFAPWPGWDRVNAPTGLLRYIQYGSVLRLLGQAEQADGPIVERIVGTGGAPVWHRLQQLTELFAARRIGYSDQPAGSSPGRQFIRPPDEVLVAPKHGTCLDLAVTFAGACLDAGIHPWLIILDPVRPGRASHAVVAVRLDTDWTTARGEAPYAVTEAPAWCADLRGRVDEPGSVVAIDIALLGTDPEVGFDQLVAAGQAMLTGGDWTWGVGLDIGAGYPHPQPLTYTGTDQHPVAEPYLEPDPSAGPLEQIKARRHVVPFHQRDELDLLLHWAHQPVAAGEGIRLAVVHGVGGSGKTHLAAELCTRLAPSNWYTGFLTTAPTDESLAWLGRTVSPLLVVVDYADAKTSDLDRLLHAVGRRPGGPTCVLLTSRTLGTWYTDTTAAILRDAIRHTIGPILELPPLHPQYRGVYRRALAAFHARREVIGQPATVDPGAHAPDGDRWTTLDLILMAWLTAHTTGDLPHHPDQLYNEVLQHEFRYWNDTVQTHYPTVGRQPAGVWADIAATLTLLGPTTDRTAAVLGAVDGYGGDANGPIRRVLSDVLTRLLPTEPDDPHLGLRPDPIGDHLLLHRLDRPGHHLLRAAVMAADDDEQLQLCATITRVGQGHPERREASRRLAATALTARPQDLWQPALSIAATQAGPFLPALEHLAAAHDTPMPLADLAASIPFGHATLRSVAVIAAQRSLPASTTASDGVATWASKLNDLAIRQAEAGDGVTALATATEAVQIYRTLAEVNPAAHLPHLAGSLTTLANLQAGTGDHATALATATESVQIYRTLATANPAPYLPDLAVSLHNLANEQAETGDRATALATATEALQIRRTLAAANPAAHLPHLAGSLNNLANLQAENGDQATALATATEAVQIRRTLAEANPAAHLPDLARSLNNLAVRQAENGDQATALATATEAVQIRRIHAEANPAAYLPDLAVSLRNLAVRQAENGDRATALATATESVQIYRTLATANPAAHLPDLARSLTTLAIEQAAAGDRATALATTTEATDHNRILAAANPAAYLPGLAGSLHNLANLQAETGDQATALATTTEATDHYSILAAANPAAYLPDLAGSLNNLAVRQAETGDQATALATATEAVQIYRTLAAANPAAYLPDLAMSLNSLAVPQAETGDRATALATATESVQIYRTLAAANPAAYLPDLARSLTTLAVEQAETGDRATALATAIESVQIRRTLAAANPAAYLPHLARSLNNLANLQAETGDQAAALATATEAVQIRRTLAAANPAAHLPDLAGSLTNLAVEQAENGDQATALATATEAVQIRRTLAEANPAAHLPDLAGSLNNLAVRQAENGDRATALATATESVQIRRTLATANPAAYLPDLAGSLNNLAIEQAAAGDQATALATATESVQIRRTLATANPAAYLPDLAVSLHTLAIEQAETGDQATALATATEAVQIRRTLAEANPAAHLPDLARSLTNMLDRYADAADVPTGLREFDEAQARLEAGAQAELLLGRSSWLQGHGEAAAALADLRQAASLAGRETNPAWAGPARRGVRAAAADLPDASLLPEWATADLPDAVFDLLKRLSVAREWTDIEEIIQAVGEGPPSHRTDLTIAQLLYPENAEPDELLSILGDVEARGLEVVVADLRSAHEHTRQLHEWLGTSTWETSHAYALRHPGLLTDQRTIALLEEADDDIAEQHLAIIRLAQQTTIDDAYDIVSDTPVATTTAMTYLATGDVDAVVDVLTAGPHLYQTPFVGSYLVAALLTLRHPDQQAQALAAIETAAAQGSDTQRAAGALRLRQLAAGRPTHAERLDELAKVLDPPVPP